MSSCRGGGKGFCTQETFEKVEEILESFGLGRYMEEVEDEAVLSLDSAKRYYDALETD